MEEFNRRGRKRIPTHKATRSRNFTLYPDQIEWLEETAARQRMTASQLLRELIAEGRATREPTNAVL